MDDAIEPVDSDAPQRYDPTRVYLYAADAKGHTVECRIKMPPWTYSMLQEIVQSPHTPYKYVTQLGRDAFIHRLEYWRDRLGSDAPAELELGLAHAKLEHRIEQQREAEAFLVMAEREFGAQSEDSPELFRADLEVALAAAPHRYKNRLRALIERLDAL